MSTPSEANRSVLARHLAAENEHRLDETLATLHERCVFRDPALGLVCRGREEIARYYRLWWDALRVRVESDGRAGWLDADTFFAEARYEGVHAGPFLDLAPSGRSVRLPFAVIVRFEDGLMSEERFHYDLATLLRQLGARELPALPARLPA